MFRLTIVYLDLFQKNILDFATIYNRYNDKDILLKLNKYIKDNKITYFMAYNAIFDYNSINNLYEILGVKNEFKKLGIEAYDYDLQDEYNETDYVYDLFCDILFIYFSSYFIVVFIKW